MKDLRYHLAELCGIIRNCDFRFVGNVAPLPSDVMWQWHDLVRDLINLARTDDDDVRLTVKLTQPPCLFSVSVSADNGNLGKHPDEYPTEIRMKWNKLGIVSSDVHTYVTDEPSSGIMIDAPGDSVPGN